MTNKNNESGFSYLEVMFSILIMTVGILAVLSALSLAMLREREVESINIARQISSSTLESIFATRDLRTTNLLTNWDAIDNDVPAKPDGIFVSGWTPIRQDPGIDGINGTNDDACLSGTNCVVNGYTNSSPEIAGFKRQIVISDIAETGIPTIRKKKILVSIRYFSGNIIRERKIATIITNLPFDNS